MKIVHIYYSLNYGGIESLLVNTINWQVKENYNVSLILINNQNQLNLKSSLNSKVKLIELKRNIGSKGILKIIKLNFLLIKNKYDIIHIHAAEIGNIIIPFLSRKIVLHIHATSAITNSKIPKFKKCIVISSAVKNVLKDDYKIYSKLYIMELILKDLEKDSLVLQIKFCIEV